MPTAESTTKQQSNKRQSNKQQSKSKKETEIVHLPEPHDTYFRRLFSDPAVAADYVRNYLPAEVVQLLDLTKIRPEKDTFVDARLRKHFSDVLFSVPLLTGGQIYVYLLFEHKSQLDKQARLQLLRYMIRIWEKEWKRRKKLSVIVPIVFYHGVEKWSYSTEFADLVDMPPALKPYTPHFQHLLTDLSGYTDGEIQGEVWLRVSFLIMKHIFDRDLGRQLPGILTLLRDLSERESGMEMLQTILTYVAEASGTVTDEELHQGVLAVVAPKREEFMPTLAQKWREEGRQLERAENAKLAQQLENERRINVQAQQQTLLRLVQWRFPLSEIEQERYQQQISRLHDLKIITRLIDHLLAAQSLTDFDTHLAENLQPV